MDEKGIAVVVVAVVVLATAGGAVAAPVIVDAVDVDPDHPLYALERLGERIQLVSDVDQMMERWNEYVRVTERGKGARFRPVLGEFREKIARQLETLPENSRARERITMWVQSQTARVGAIRARLLIQVCEEIRAALPEFADEMNGYIEEIQGYRDNWMSVNEEEREGIRASMAVIRERLREIVENREQLKEALGLLDAENEVSDGEVWMIVEIRLRVMAFNPANLYNWQLSRFENYRERIQNELDNLPENAFLIDEINSVISVADSLKDLTVTAREENRMRAALVYITQANAMLFRADVLIHISAHEENIPMPLLPWRAATPSWRRHFWRR